MADQSEENTVLAQTIEDDKSKFFAYEYSKAKLARTIQQRIRHPSTSHYIWIVLNKGIPNCPIMVQDIQNAEFIWGPDIGCLKGKTVWTQPPAVRVQNYNIPLQVMQQYRHVILSAEIMKVNNIPFFMTISKHIKVGSAGKLDNIEDKTILRLSLASMLPEDSRLPS